MRSHALSRHRRTQAPDAATGVVHLSRRTLLAVGLGAAVILAWAGAVTWYIASRDELAQRVFVRETEMKFAYEDRIAHLSTRLEREVTQNLVERRTVDTRIAAVAARQAEIESRQEWLRTAAEQAGIGGVTGSIGALSSAADRKPAPKPASLSGDPKPASVPELRLREERVQTEQSQPPRDRLSALERRLELTGREEIATTKSLGLAARARLAQLRSALDATGLDLAWHGGNDRGLGGPFVPVNVKPGSGPAGFLSADLGSSLAGDPPARRAGPHAPAARAARWRPGADERLRGAVRSLHPRAGDAYGARFPGRAGQPRAGDGRGPDRLGRVLRRLRQHGRDRPRGRRGHAIRPLDVLCRRAPGSG